MHPARLAAMITGPHWPYHGSIKPPMWVEVAFLIGEGEDKQSSRNREPKWGCARNLFPDRLRFRHLPAFGAYLNYTISSDYNFTWLLNYEMRKPIPSSWLATGVELARLAHRRSEIDISSAATNHLAADELCTETKVDYLEKDSMIKAGQAPTEESEAILRWWQPREVAWPRLAAASSSPS